MATITAAVARTLLFVPGDKPERFDKAVASGADLVIVDLEDAVDASRKEAARTAVSTWLTAKRSVLVRVNAVDTQWHLQDLEVAGLPGVCGVVLPKSESAKAIDHVAQRLPGLPIWPLIETARGVHAAADVAGGAQVKRLLFGSVDLQLDLGVESDAELDVWRSSVVLASRVAGIAAPIDGVTTAIEDMEQLSSDAARARRMGFGGKLCIHPKQLVAVRTAFGPTPKEIAWARRVLEATSGQDSAVRVDGVMVDRPVIERARRLLLEADLLE